MNNDINLISNQNVGLEKEQKRLKKFRLTSVTCLIAVLLVSVLIFLLNLTLPLQTVKDEQSATAASIATLHKKLVTYTLINDRIKNISNVISKRGNDIPQLNQILGKIPTDLTVGGLEIQAGQISITVFGTSLVPINKFIDDMVSFGAQGKVIKDLVIEGLSLDASSGQYTLNMKANIL